VVFERSQGNALLVEEILAAVDGGADPGDLPPSPRDVLPARTDTVSEDAQRVLRAASASAPRVEERLLEAVAGLGSTPRCARWSGTTCWWSTRPAAVTPSGTS
jgi:hypothetical protein